MLFPLWLSLFIPSGAILLLFSSSILDTYRPGDSGFWHLSKYLSVVHRNGMKAQEIESHTSESEYTAFGKAGAGWLWNTCCHFHLPVFFLLPALLCSWGMNYLCPQFFWLKVDKNRWTSLDRTGTVWFTFVSLATSLDNKCPINVCWRNSCLRKTNYEINRIGPWVSLSRELFSVCWFLNSLLVKIGINNWIILFFYKCIPYLFYSFKPFFFS